MSSLVTIILVLVSVCSNAVYADTLRQDFAENRNVAQFGAMILHTVGNPLGYNGYGCWCGKGHRGELVVDATDRCCQVHDLCWKTTKGDIKGCDAYWRSYKYKKLSSGAIACMDRVDTCDYRSCMCDKAAAECFARHRKSSYDSDFDNWKGLCTNTTKAMETDPDRCPPVWSNRARYARGSLASIHGIVYQCVRVGGTRDDPLTSLKEQLPAWKKLGRCRRTNTAMGF